MKVHAAVLSCHVKTTGLTEGKTGVAKLVGGFMQIFFTNVQKNCILWWGCNSAKFSVVIFLQSIAQTRECDRSHHAVTFVMLHRCSSSDFRLRKSGCCSHMIYDVSFYFDAASSTVLSRSLFTFSEAQAVFNLLDSKQSCV